MAMESDIIREFKSSKCFKCGYCLEKGETDPDELDVRKNGVIKIWCHAAGHAGDCVPIMVLTDNEKCHIEMAADNERE